MRLRLFVLGFSIIVVSCFDRKKERKLVEQTWHNYVHAVANNMGTEAVKYLDSATVNYYSYVLTLIKTADSFTVSKLRFDQKLMVLGIRASTPKNKIARFDGRSLYAHSVQMGMCSSNGTPTETIEVLSIDPAKAEAQLLDTNNVRGLKFTFYHEFGQWKLNLTKVLETVGQSGWDAIIRESGRSEREVIDFIIQETCDSALVNNPWQPL